MKVHESIKAIFGYKKSDGEKEILRDWKSRTKELCKPCWELHYCPYGPLVEDFPLLPVTRKEAEEHNAYLEECIRTGISGSGGKLDKKKISFFKKMLSDSKKRNYPEVIPEVFSEASCNVFGHICPVYFVAEPLTETKVRRKHSRIIPRDVMIKVIRRDGQICQKCQNPVPDNEVEFDHIIPFSKGGTSTVDNLRVVHKECNRKKSDSLEEILHPNPIEHLLKKTK